MMLWGYIKYCIMIIIIELLVDFVTGMVCDVP